MKPSQPYRIRQPKAWRRPSRGRYAGIPRRRAPRPRGERMRGAPLIQCSEDPCLDAFPSPSSVESGAGAPAKPEDDMIRLAIVMAFLLSQVDLAAARGGGGPPRFDIKATCRSAQP